MDSMRVKRMDEHYQFCLVTINHHFKQRQSRKGSISKERWRLLSFLGWDHSKASSALSCKKKDQKSLLLSHISDNKYIWGICHIAE